MMIITMLIGTLFFLVVFGSFFGAVFLSSKVAEYHYRTYTGDQPLFLIYGMVSGVIWGYVMMILLIYAGIITSQ